MFVPDHFDEGLGPDRGPRHGRGHHDHAQRRSARVRLRLPPSRGARPRAGDHRPAVGRAARGRARRGVEEPRLRPLRHPDGPAEGARRPHDRAHAGPAWPLRRRLVLVRGRALHDHRARRDAAAAPARRPADPHRRRRAPGAALRGLDGRHRRCERVDPLRGDRHRRRAGRVARAHRREGRVGARAARGALRRPRAERVARGGRGHRRHRRGGGAARGPVRLGPRIGAGVAARARRLRRRDRGRGSSSGASGGATRTP